MHIELDTVYNFPKVHISIDTWNMKSDFYLDVYTILNRI